MVIRSTKQNTEKKVSAVDNESLDECRRLVITYKSEISRLQKLLAKKQVEHESAIEKVRAEAAAKQQPPHFILTIPDTLTHKPSDSERDNSLPNTPRRAPKNKKS
jgi:hypothetical protein